MKTIFSYFLFLISVSLYAQPACSPSGNTLVFANYDGGVLNINVDVNIPNLKIGVCTYEPVTINLTGAYASNVTQLIRAGYPNTNHNHCGLGVTTTAINGPVPANYSIIDIPPVSLSNPNGYNGGIICAYTCNSTTNQGGCNTMDQVLDYFQSQFSGTLYSVKAQYCCWKNSSTYFVSALSGSCCVASNPSATISYMGTPYCKSVSSTQAVSLSGDAGGSYSSSPAGLSIDAGTGAVNPSLSTVGTYTVTYTIAGCPDFTTSTSVEILTSPSASITYAANSFCTGGALQNVTLSGTSGGVFSAAAGLSIDTLTGTIDPAQSTAGNYTVTYSLDSVPGCSAFSTSTVVDISAAVTSSFSHSICEGETYAFGNYLADTTGVYADTTTTTGGCDSIVQLNLTVLSSPSVTLSADSTSFCPGDSVQICVSNGSGTYLWNTGSADQCIYATNAGNYYLTVTDGNNCTALSAPVSVTTYTPPSVSVSVSGDTIRAFNGVSYRWYLDGNQIINAYDSIYVATIDGSYQVEIIDSNGCSSFSNAIPVIHNGLKKTEEMQWNVFPNPVENGRWMVQCNADVFEARIELFNATGQKIYEAELTGRKTAMDFQPAKGVYYLHLHIGENTTVKKLVKL